MATLLIKLVTVPRKATRSATTVVVRVTSPENARLLLNPNPAIDAVKKATFPVNAQIKSLARAVAAVVGAVVVVAAAILAVAATQAVAAAAVVVKNATNAVKSVTLHVTALRVEEVVTAVEAGMEAGTPAEAAVVVVVAAARPAIPAAASVTCLVIAPRARSATTVSPRYPFPSQSQINAF